MSLGSALGPTEPGFLADGSGLLTVVPSSALPDSGRPMPSANGSYSEAVRALVAADCGRQMPMASSMVGGQRGSPFSLTCTCRESLGGRLYTTCGGATAKEGRQLLSC